MQEKKKARPPSGAARHCGEARPDQIQHALDLEAAVSTLESKLNEKRICENAVSHTIEVIRDFYDADCVLVVVINPQSLTLRCENKVYREGFISSIIEALIVPGTPELIREMMQVKTFTVLDIPALAKNNVAVYRSLSLAGLRQMLTIPYGVPSNGLLSVCNPRKHTAHSSLLCMAAYVIAVELPVQNRNQLVRSTSCDGAQLAENEVYIKLLDGFELHTKEGMLTEQAIQRKQGVVFLALLLFQKGQLLPIDSLLESLWDDPDILTDPERTLRNLGYSVRKNIEHLFAGGDFLKIQKTGFAIGRKYMITTDFDRFVLRVCEADQLTDGKAKLEHYTAALDAFQGVVLPHHKSKVIDRIAGHYHRKRTDVQNTALSLMFNLNLFERMYELIDQALVCRGWDKDLFYWDIKAKMGMQMFAEARSVFLANKEKFSDLQLEELSVLV